MNELFNIPSSNDKKIKKKQLLTIYKRAPKSAMEIY